MKHTRSQCACCKQVFAGTRAFDAHRVGPYARRQRKRRCLTCKEMHLQGMTQNEQGWWMLPAPQPNTDDAPDRTDRSLPA